MYVCIELVKNAHNNFPEPEPMSSVSKNSSQTPKYTEFTMI